MKKQKDANYDPNKEKSSHHNSNHSTKSQHQITPVGWWITIGAIAIFSVLVLFAIFHPNMAERIKFVSANTLNLLILVAIVIQAYIYRRQWEAMERQVKVAERSIQLANDTFDVGEAPYFGITEMSLMDFNPGQWPRLIITFVNGGKTPAWNFDVKSEVVFGDNPQEGERFQCKLCGRIDNRFAIPHIPITIEYQGTVEAVQERIELLFKKKVKLFVISTISYRDRGDKRYCKSFVRIDMQGSSGRELCDYDIDDNQP